MQGRLQKYLGGPDRTGPWESETETEDRKPKKRNISLTWLLPMKACQRGGFERVFCRWTDNWIDIQMEIIHSTGYNPL